MTESKSRTVKVLSAVGIILPLLAIANQLAFFALVSENEWLNQHDRAEKWIITGMALFAVAGVAAICTGVYFLSIVFKSELPESQKTFWVMGLFMFFPVLGPIFWYRVIWRGMDFQVATVRA